MRNLQRTRNELAAFLRARRERLSPADVGLPSGGRRRTPGLRREEVAALAGVGLTWYTWLEQGRDIGVSATFLDNLARVFKLDAAERRHLFLLAHERPPAEPGKTFCVVPPLVLRLMHDLAPHAAYVLNLRWDVLAFNEAADRLFGFERHAPEQRNMLWMLFTDPLLRERFDGWKEQAPQILSSFRRDYARATQEADIQAMVDELQKVSPDFKYWWSRHDVHAPCKGIRDLRVDDNVVAFEHVSLTIDAERHLRLVVYAQKS
ncbi:transcriptional regulator [Alkalilimnicola ehrlichii]|uniref:Transcriptional regulator n=1 Tax=Alkalilimnicola ehrlichii TaxID=351052 RepID=A0A3E0WZJ7_9GAMM|nr:helix-turn-helix transcriptional regulator [Alkalilimnicola ehrlichii]RFA30696.1 transcriptional regulator [Alkalilimnicola ehrlichii]RFA38274.1 transcriptional regulator [Alkalilimnicola ehrlichii]